MHLAQFNIGRLTHDLDDPRNADFIRGAEMLNRIADQSPGFVWKYETAQGGVVQDEVDGDPRIVVNMTVWERLADFEHFVWKTLHKHFLARKRDWFTPLCDAHFVMWWIAPGRRPTLADARKKLAMLRAHGSSDEAFGWDWLQAGRAQA